MAYFFHTFTIILLFFSFTLAAPISFGGTALAVVAANRFKNGKTIHRLGAKNGKNVVGGGIRHHDWNKQDDGTVHSHDTKGLSFHSNAVNIPKDKALYTIKTGQLRGTGFKAVHDGGRDGHGQHHVSLTYHGPPIPHADLKKKVNSLPFKTTKA
ncbi:hypothetical protein M413DRAFT_9171 [Hebeloma cylindrosporum]|uniref:Uncharacterized protein n=1 Tax=Hebeloma cylindrosporum TaxID=76867 RepID=A0A0C3C7Y8_HEBCY|nr:hypothetical protein M413DRAFT_9171 [Hebeloma cylindrosporum h7]